MGFSKTSAKGMVHSNTGLPQETRKNQVNKLTLHLKQLEKRRNEELQGEWKERNHKIYGRNK